MKQDFLRTLNRIDQSLVKVLEWICIALFVAITFILTLSIVVRFIPFMSMHWWISKFIPSMRGRFAYRLFVELLSLLFIVIFFKYALALMLQTEEQTTAFAMSKKWLYACMPITGGIMVLYTLKNMWLELAKIVNPALDIEAGKENLNH